MKIEKGMYFRVYGQIDKVTRIVRQGSLYEDSGIYGTKKKYIIGSKVIDEVPHSYNIIDLIEVGDYVNGMPIYQYDNHLVINKLDGSYLYLDELKEIKDIVTKEQFESVKYDVNNN